MSLCKNFQGFDFPSNSPILRTCGNPRFMWKTDINPKYQAKKLQMNGFNTTKWLSPVLNLIQNYLSSNLQLLQHDWACGLLLCVSHVSEEGEYFLFFGILPSRSPVLSPPTLPPFPHPFRSSSLDSATGRILLFTPLYLSSTEQPSPSSSVLVLDRRVRHVWVSRSWQVYLGCVYSAGSSHFPSTAAVYPTVTTHTHTHTYQFTEGGSWGLNTGSILHRVACIAYVLEHNTLTSNQYFVIYIFFFKKQVEGAAG